MKKKYGRIIVMSICLLKSIEKVSSCLSSLATYFITGHIYRTCPTQTYWSVLVLINHSQRCGVQFLCSVAFIVCFYSDIIFNECPHRLWDHEKWMAGILGNAPEKPDARVCGCKTQMELYTNLNKPMDLTLGASAWKEILSRWLIYGWC